MILPLKKIIPLLLLTCIHFSVSGQDFQPIPNLESPVTDLTNTLSSTERSNLESLLANYSREKGSQVVVLIVSTTEPEDIASYSIRVAEEWKIGREDIDDGVILLVAKDDRNLRIEVGYGLEGAIPDAYAKRIIENIIIPEFRNGQFYAGISNGVGAIIGLIEGEQLPAVTQDRFASRGNGGGIPIKKSFALLMILTFVGVSIVKALVKNKAVKAVIAVIIAIIIAYLFANIVLFFISLIIALFVMFSNGGPGRGGGVFYGGGFGGGGYSGGGGFGGFSGGGGGFGGGGASGSW